MTEGTHQCAGLTPVAIVMPELTVSGAGLKSVAEALRVSVAVLDLLQGVGPSELHQLPQLRHRNLELSSSLAAIRPPSSAPGSSPFGVKLHCAVCHFAHGGGG